MYIHMGLALYMYMLCNFYASNNYIDLSYHNLHVQCKYLKSHISLSLYLPLPDIAASLPWIPWTRHSHWASIALHGHSRGRQLIWLQNAQGYPENNWSCLTICRRSYTYVATLILFNHNVYSTRSKGTGSWGRTACITVHADWLTGKQHGKSSDHILIPVVLMVLPRFFSFIWQACSMCTYTYVACVA